MQTGTMTDFWTPITETPPKDIPLIIRICYPQGGIEYRLAMYASRYSLQADEDWEDDGEYNEGNDTYYCPEGWYEKSASHDDITWWMLSGAELAGITDWAKIPKKEANA